MSGAEADGLALAWVIPPSVDPEGSAGNRPSSADVRELAEELETACRPDEVRVEVVPGGVSRIVFHFADREAAFDVFDVAQSRVRARPDVVCRIVAVT